MLRKRKTRLYKEETNDEEADGDKRGFDLMEQIKLNRSNDRDNKTKYLLELTGDNLTLALVQKQGFSKPILVKKNDGLDITVPTKNFFVKDVRNHVGPERIIDVMDVETQKNIEMSMEEFCKYYESKHKDRLLNVISLEFSHTELDELVQSPKIVRLLDWVDQVWPKFLKESQTESTNSIDKMKYPKVQKYCLMSVKGSYTDFHIDFGGTSVWYHILRGKKIFWMIPPTEFNLQTFEDWTLSGMQQHVFFGDTVEECFRVELSAGHTFFIPSGWIHAVYTLEDSLVFGGNFLHSYGIEKQLKVASIEDATKVPVKFRYPFYTEIQWYVVQHYVTCLSGREHDQKKNQDDEQQLSSTPPQSNDTSSSSSKTTHYTWSNPKDEVQETKKVHLTTYEIVGLKALVKHLAKLSRTKKNLPTLIKNSRTLLDDCRKLIAEHENDDPELAITGEPITTDLLKSSKPDMNELIGQFFKEDNTELLSPKKESKIVNSSSPNKPKAVATVGLPATSSASTPTASSTPPPRSKSPPTRPLSKNQYTNKTKASSATSNNNLTLPGSFADLIAATSTEKKVFDTSGVDSTAYLQTPLKKRLIEAIPTSQISPNSMPSQQQQQQDQLLRQQQEQKDKERQQEQELKRRQDQQRHLEMLRRQQQDRQRHQEQLRRQQHEQLRLQELQRKEQEQRWHEQQREQEKVRHQELQRLELQRIEQQRLEQQRLQEKQRLQQLEQEKKRRDQEEERKRQDQELEQKRQEQLRQQELQRQQQEEEKQRQSAQLKQQQHQQQQQQHQLQQHQQQALQQFIRAQHAQSIGAGLTPDAQKQFLISRPVLFNPLPNFSAAQLARPATSLPLLTSSMASPLGLPMQQGARLVWATPPVRFSAPVGGSVALANQTSAHNSDVKYSIASKAQVSSTTTAAASLTQSSQPKSSPQAIDNAALLSLATTALSTAPMMSSPALSQMSNRAATTPRAIMVSPAVTQQQQVNAVNAAALLAGQQLYSQFLPRVSMATHYIARPGTTGTTTTRPTMGQLVFARIPHQTNQQQSQQRYLITQPHFMAAQRFQQPLGIPSSQPAQTLAFATFKPTAASPAEPPKSMKTAKKVNTN